MRRIVTRGLAAGAGLCLAAGLGLTAASAATPTTSPSASSPTPSAGLGALLPRRLVRLAGEVVSDTASGGPLGHGQLVLKQPDGNQVTLVLAARTKAWRYQGLGESLTSEAPGSLSAGEVVGLSARSARGQRVAVRILDLGFTAAG